MRQRTALGLLFAALLVPLSAAILVALKDFSIAGIQAAFTYAVMLAAFTVPITLLVGLPLLIWYRRAGWHGWHHYVIGGAGLGLLPVVVFAALGSISLAFALGLAVGGASSALLLWVFTGRHDARAENGGLTLSLASPAGARAGRQDPSRMSG
jgi:hypothetical protein